MTNYLKNILYNMIYQKKIKILLSSTINSVKFNKLDRFDKIIYHLIKLNLTRLIFSLWNYI